jgi:ABC-2 type transport system ATP-binding protein
MDKETVVSVEHAQKMYSSGDFWRPIRTKALQDVSLKMRSGEVFGLVGLNGAGKTTLMKLLVGLLRPDQGRVRVFGQDPCGLQAKPKFGFLPELPYFPKYLSAWEVLRFYGKLHDLEGAGLLGRVQEVLEMVGLWGRHKDPIREYSKGMQQRVGLAQTLLHDPELLFLDEPMSGLDPVGIKEMRDLLIRLHAEGKTLFFNTHILSEVERLCDRVGVLSSGRMILVDSVANLVARHQSSLTLGFVKPHPGALRLLRRRGLKPVMDNQVWAVKVPTNSLKEILVRISKFRMPAPSVLSLGSPLETALLKGMKEN